MKKVLIATLCLVLALTFMFGCAKEAVPAAETAAEQVESAAPEAAKTEAASEAPAAEPAKAASTTDGDVDFEALYAEVASLTNQDAIDYFNSLADKGLSQAQILEFFINLPISESNQEIYDLYYAEQLDMYANEYPTPNFVDGYSWQMGSGTEITGPYSDLPEKLPFTDYVPIEAGTVGDPNTTYKIGVVFHGFDHPWLISWADSAGWQLQQFSNVEFTILDAEYDNAKMATYIDQFIAEEVDGILVWPQEMAPTEAPIERAIAAGIPVVTSDRLSGSKNVDSRVTGGLPSNGAQMGMFLAYQMSQENDYSQNIVMLRKPLGGSSEALRTGNMLKVMSYFPEVKVLQSYHDTDSREEAFANAQAALSAYDNIDIFFCTGDHEVLAAIEAVQQANRMNGREDGKKMIFVTPDDGKEDMYYIEQGILDMDVPLTPFQADIAARVLVKAVTGEEVPYDVTVPNIPMITKDGVTIFGFETQTPDMWYEYTFGPEL